MTAEHARWRRVEIEVPPHIRDPQRYFDRTVQYWHTVAFPVEDDAIDLDLGGFCSECSHPIYLIEAAETERKSTAYLKQLARQSGVPGFLVVHQDKVVLGGRRVYPAPQTAMLDESALRDYLARIRFNHRQDQHWSGP